ncbi:MAG: hypothetical protein AAF902_10725 [Chloroflexota bacterium]
MFHILLFMSRLPEAEEISHRLAAKESYIVHRVSNLREAGTLLTRQRIDLAIVAVNPNDSLVYSLNMLQENLPVLLIAEVSNQYVSERQRKMAWGIVTYERLTEAFPALDILTEPKDKVEEIFLKDLPDSNPVINTKKLSALISGTVKKFGLEMIMFTRNQELIGIHAKGDQDQLVRVGRHVRKSWGNESGPGQLSWYTDHKGTLGPNGRPVRYLLLTIPYESFLVTLVSGESGTIMQMRKATHRILSGMREVENSEGPADVEHQLNVAQPQPAAAADQAAAV